MDKRVNSTWCCSKQWVGQSIYAMVGSVLFDIMREKGYGVNTKGAMSGRKLNLVGFDFFDNTNLIETRNNRDDIYEVDQRL